MVNDDGMPSPPFVQSDGNSRAKRPSQADERTTLVAFLRWHRETLEHKCAGLESAQLAERAVGRSALSLLGLVRHAAESERFWFRRVMAGQELPPLFSSPDSAFDVASANAQMVAQAWQAWQTEIAFADRFVDAAQDLELTGNEPGEGPVSLRWVLMHMVEEYARHNGHADLLREQIDGAVGL
ncbi:DinB family protein [Nonomuraea sp. NPDC026600]|uniref:DinB family protein n=1 Tax=Nonomuraea sp. NPDC026600 TaxID=3155363 RepID=UPI003407DB4E